MTIEIDRDLAISTLEKVVELRGEAFIYDPPNPEAVAACYYTWEGQPSCGVGLALSMLGVPVEGLKMLDFDSSVEHEAPKAVDKLDEVLAAGGLLPYLPEPVIVTPSALAAFGAFQGAQDRGVDYATALQRAKAA